MWPEPLQDVDRSDEDLRAWVAERIHRLDADGRRSADTHLVRLDLPEDWDIQLYLKDETTHSSGSLKHRLARSLFLFALVNGQLRPGMPVIEASSGSTAVPRFLISRRPMPFALRLALMALAFMGRVSRTRKDCTNGETTNRMYTASGSPRNSRKNSSSRGNSGPSMMPVI